MYIYKQLKYKIQTHLFMSLYKFLCKLKIYTIYVKMKCSYIKMACVEHGITNTKVLKQYVYRLCNHKNFVPKNFSHIQ